MKRSNLALAVLTAIAVAACGGSSSNDDAPVDKKPTTPAKPVKPTTPETSNTETPEEKTPETPETPAVAGGGAGGAGGKTDTTKKNEKKPEAPAGGGHGGGKTKPKTADEAEALLIKAKADETAKTATFNDLNTKLTAANNALTDFNKTTDPDSGKNKIAALKEEKDAAEKGNGTFSQAKQAELDTLLSEQAALQKAVKTLTDAQEKANVAKEDAELKALDAEIDHLELTKPKSVVAVTKADKDLKQAAVDTRRATLTKEDASKESGKWAAEAKSIQSEIKELDKKIGGLAEKGDLAGAKTLSDKKEGLKEKLDDVNKKKAAEDAKVEAAKKVIDAAEKVTKKANEARNIAVKAAKIRGQEGDKATIATGEGFKGIDFVVKEDKKWLITFKGDEKATELDLTTAVNLETAGTGKVNKDASYGNFVFKEEEKDGKKTVTADYGLVVLDNDNENVATSAYGYVNDKFFHFGQLASVEKVKELNGTNYKGSAFVKTNEEKPRRLIADVEATAKFNDVPTPVLEGTFSGFQSYIGANGAKDLQPVTAIGDTDVSQDKSLSFRALIKDNGFQASKEAPGDLKVYGNFYGVGDKEGKEIGGFVEHDDFYGSFGGKHIE